MCQQLLSIPTGQLNSPFMSVYWAKLEGSHGRAAIRSRAAHAPQLPCSRACQPQSRPEFVARR